MIPYTVEGFIMVCWSVSFGVSSPKAAIELGQKTLSRDNSLPASNVLNNAFMLISSVFKGLTSPVAESKAVRQ